MVGAPGARPRLSSIGGAFCIATCPSLARMAHPQASVLNRYWLASRYSKANCPFDRKVGSRRSQSNLTESRDRYDVAILDIESDVWDSVAPAEYLIDIFRDDDEVPTLTLAWSRDVPPGSDV